MLKAGFESLRPLQKISRAPRHLRGRVGSRSTAVGRMKRDIPNRFPRGGARPLLQRSSFSIPLHSPFAVSLAVNFVEPTDLPPCASTAFSRADLAVAV